MLHCDRCCQITLQRHNQQCVPISLLCQLLKTDQSARQHIMAEQSSSCDAQLHSEQLFEAQPRLHSTAYAMASSDAQRQPSTLTGKHSGAEQGHLKLSQQLDRAGNQHEAAPRQQACATDEGDFERMMARFAELEKQEAAQSGKDLAGMQCRLSMLYDDTCDPHKLCCFRRICCQLSVAHPLPRNIQCICLGTCCLMSIHNTCEHQESNQS